MGGTPQAEIEITKDLVRSLLKSQHPDLAHQYRADADLQFVDAGWDNVMFRLGQDLCLRLPRRQAAAGLILHEQTFLPHWAPMLPLPVPSPVRVGKPASFYPWHWSIVPWLQGESANVSPPHPSQAMVLANFLKVLHSPVSLTTSMTPPVNPFRGVPLQERAPFVEPRLTSLKEASRGVTPEIFRIWDKALSAPQSNETVWLHGDLHPRNILVHHGKISGIIDWGDMTAGDPATDLAALWMLFDPSPERDAAIAFYNPSPATMARAKGWAIAFGAFLLESGLVDHPQHAVLGEAIFQRLSSTRNF
ncbi:MAG: aminoglycoside phosphotransferase family protein [Cyanobacteria bacterium]|nr:aminoglycoside phosphotransferase family protein [Cyanobacteriota bacterium]